MARKYRIMLGNDLYKIEGVNDISSSELKSLVLLYKELSSKDIVTFYLSLLYQKRSDFSRLINLLNYLNISADVFEELSNELEKLGLLETYKKGNSYIFVIKKILSYEDFFNHSIYGRLLLKRVDRNHFYYLKSMSINDGADKSGYQNISNKAIFKELEGWTSNLEDEYNVFIPKKDLDVKKIDSNFNIDRFVKSIGSTLFPHSLRTYDNLSEIAKLADAYSIKEEDMRRFLKDAISINPLKFDKEKLNYLCKTLKNSGYIAYEDGKYKMPCISFLLKLKNGKELVPYDANIIDNLIHKYHLKPEVINVLLEYSLKTCDNQLITKFIYAIAANWYNNDIDTSEKALAQLNKVKPSVNRNKNYGKRDILPVYDSSNNVEVSNDDIEKYLRRDD